MLYLFSHIAAEYDERHGKTLDRLIEEIRARLNFIGADWVDDDDDDNDVDDAGAGVKQKDESPVKTVRLLDYACGTGVGELIHPQAQIFSPILSTAPRSGS